jgi:hypothetical protein
LRAYQIAIALQVGVISCGARVALDGGGSGADAGTILDAGSIGAPNLCALALAALTVPSACSHCHGTTCDYQTHCGADPYDCVKGWECVGQCGPDGACIATCIAAHPGIVTWLDCVSTSCGSVCAAIELAIPCPLADGG